MKNLKIIVTVFMFMCAAWTHAVERQPFTKALFDKAQADGVPVLIDIYAAWCPTCERQQTILSRYFREHPSSSVLTLVVDFDKDKNWVTYFKAPRQSTLYLYKNNEQRWFAVAETSTRKIEAQLLAIEQAKVN